MTRRLGKISLAVSGLALAGSAMAQDAAAPPALSPALAGPLTYNPDPINFEMPLLGKVYVTGIGSGLVGAQSNSVPGTAKTFGDVSNAQIIVQKPEGVFQFLVQAGLYNHGTLGTPLLRSTTYTANTHGVVPQAWIKLAPSANFNIQAGILPTLIGLETPFTFQNMNIDRGILWGQENVLTRGVQANATLGKLALSVALTDGFFSGKYNWLSGAATYSFDSSNILSVIVGGALSKNTKSAFVTPVLQNNSFIANVIYTYTSGPLLLQPYFQYTKIPSLAFLGTTKTETWSGALLARYTISENFSLPVRFEYVDSTGSAAQGSASPLYGAGSNAFTFTITPTYTFSRFFIRPEFSVVKASKITLGSAFGSDGRATSQVRGRLEFGVMF
ncbi:outer membrane beta-barrel protein [Sandarakinorhabdus sp.]|uniref:outer membrane beta-barrel protein n=1 Tax=Sandarakinorhabdus sp. TaxID=1916663 RepID=UPI00286E995F|nr:outer membrane beta-barrel protein [Sandarakinorhabdus sp.]